MKSIVNVNVRTQRLKLVVVVNKNGMMSLANANANQENHSWDVVHKYGIHISAHVAVLQNQKRVVEIRNGMKSHGEFYFEYHLREFFQQLHTLLFLLYSALVDAILTNPSMAAQANRNGAIRNADVNVEPQCQLTVVEDTNGGIESIANVNVQMVNPKVDVHILKCKYIYKAKILKKSTNFPF